MPTNTLISWTIMGILNGCYVQQKEINFSSALQNLYVWKTKKCFYFVLEMGSFFYFYSFSFYNLCFRRCIFAMFSWFYSLLFNVQKRLWFRILIIKQFEIDLKIDLLAFRLKKNGFQIHAAEMFNSIKNVIFYIFLNWTSQLHPSPLFQPKLNLSHSFHIFQMIPAWRIWILFILCNQFFLLSLQDLPFRVALNR